MAFDPVIGGRFFFTAGDLDANRGGYLSAEQEHLLDVTVVVQGRHARRSTWLVAAAFGLAIVLTGVAIGTTPGAGLASAAIAAVILAGVMGIVLWAVSRGRRTRQAMRDRRLRTAEGLREDARYRVHYLELPDGAMPLSIEAID